MSDHAHRHSNEQEESEQVLVHTPESHPAVIENEPTALRKKALYFIASAVLIAVITAGIWGYNVYQYKQLAAAYNSEFTVIASASSDFKKDLDASSKDTTASKLREAINHYQQMKDRNTFEVQLKTLNDLPKYDKIRIKKEVSTLQMQKANETLDKILKDAEKIQVLVQKNDNIDSEIKVLETSTTSTIGDIDKKTEDLNKKNDAIKDEALGIAVHDYLKVTLSAFSEALNYRGKYLIEKKAANLAYLDYKVADGRAKDYEAQAKSYKQQGDNSYYSASLYYGWSREYAQKAIDQYNEGKAKLKQSDEHDAEAKKMLAKYVELIGNSPDGSSSTGSRI
jgi:hypothetical protein